MSTVSIPVAEAPAKASTKRLWVAAGAACLLLVVMAGLAFYGEAVHAVQVWNASTAYNHCFLILPISAFLIWERRDALLARLPEPSFLPLLLLVPVGLVWLLAAEAQITEARQFAAMALVQVTLLALLGPRTWRIISFALLYLFFLVPSGAFLVPALQRFTASFAVHGLQIVGIPVFSDGMTIEIPEGKFVVAEACAGLRFLIASVAIGALYGYMMYRDWWRRAAFLAVSVVVPIIANGFRALGIVVFGHIIGSAEAAAADHLIYGWVFFSFVSLLLIVLGLPFRQPVPAFPVEPTERPASRRPQLAMAGVVALAGGFMLLLTSQALVEGGVGQSIGTLASDIRQILGR